MASWQRKAAYANHALLYACLILQPIWGYLGSTFTKYPIKYFGVTLPRWGWESDALKELFSALHFATACLLVAVVAVHGALEWVRQRHYASRPGVVLARVAWLVSSRSREPSQVLEAQLHSAGVALPAGPSERFSERIVAPIAGALARLAARLTPAGAQDKIAQKLVLAGSPEGWTAERVLALKGLGLVLGFLVGYVVRGVVSIPGAAVLIPAASSAFAADMPVRRPLPPQPAVTARHSTAAVSRAITVTTFRVLMSGPTSRSAE